MSKPKYTDLDRYKNGYTRSESTNIEKTWERARKRIEAEAAKRAEIVQELPRIGKKVAR